MWENKNEHFSKIRSNYNLKTIFSYLDYPYILKLIKYNKNLQSKLGLTLENYKNKSDFNKYEYIKKTQIISKYYKKQKIPEESLINSMVRTVTFFFLIPFLIYSILLVSIKTFKDSNTKDIYNNNYYNIIKTINPCLFIYDGLILGFCFLRTCYIYYNYAHDYGKRKIIKFIIMIFINLVHFLFEFLVIFKLILSYKIKKGGCLVYGFRLFIYSYKFYIYFMFFTCNIFFF